MPEAIKVRDLSPDFDPWERQPAEKEQCFSAFVAYRDAGEDRSIRAVTRVNGNDPAEAHKPWRTQAQRWSVQWRWRERCAAYDRHLDAAKVKATRKIVAQMAEGHASLTNAALGVLQEPIAEVIRRIKARTFDLGHTAMSDKELLKFVRQSAAAIRDLIGAERVARGAPSDVTGVLGANAQVKSLAEAVDEMWAAAGFSTGSPDQDDTPIVES